MLALVSTALTHDDPAAYDLSAVLLRTAERRKRPPCVNVVSERDERLSHQSLHLRPFKLIKHQAFLFHVLYLTRPHFFLTTLRTQALPKVSDI